MRTPSLKPSRLLELNFISKNLTPTYLFPKAQLPLTNLHQKLSNPVLAHFVLNFGLWTLVGLIFKEGMLLEYFFGKHCWKQNNEEFSVKRQILAFLKRKKVLSEKANSDQNSSKIYLLLPKFAFSQNHQNRPKNWNLWPFQL